MTLERNEPVVALVGIRRRNMERDTQSESPSYPFTPSEFERLYAFRQALLAGFYTDELAGFEATTPTVDGTEQDTQTSELA